MLHSVLTSHYNHFLQESNHDLENSFLTFQISQQISRQRGHMENPSQQKPGAEETRSNACRWFAPHSGGGVGGKPAG